MMSDLQVVKEEPIQSNGNKNNHAPTPLSIQQTSTAVANNNNNTTNPNPVSNGNINPNQNPFGPSSSHNKPSQPPQPPQPPPFQPNGYPIPPPPGYPPSYPPTHTPFGHPPVPYPVPNPYDPNRGPMFYGGLPFGQQPPPIPHHYDYTQQHQPQPPTNSDQERDEDRDRSKKDRDREISNGPSATPPSSDHNGSNHNGHGHGHKPKAYTSFTPRMQPGAYFLVPLTHNQQQTNAQHGVSSTAAYMPLINGSGNGNGNTSDNKEEGKEEHHNHNSSSSDTSPTNSNSSTSDSEHEHEQQHQHRHNHNHHTQHQQQHDHQIDNESQSEQAQRATANATPTNHVSTTSETETETDQVPIPTHPHPPPPHHPLHPHPHHYLAHGVYGAPQHHPGFLNVVGSNSNGHTLPHIPFPVPLTPTRGGESIFPPPPIPLPYDMSNTQFSLAPIINTNNHGMDQKTIPIEDKKNIIVDENKTSDDNKDDININQHQPVLHTSFMMQHPMQMNGHLAFPPLPTSNHTGQPAHSMPGHTLNSTFAGTDINDSRLAMPHPPHPIPHIPQHVPSHVLPIPPMLTPGGDSSDQDMDVALNGAQHIPTLGQMPTIQPQHHNHNHNQNHNHNHNHNYNLDHTTNTNTTSTSSNTMDTNNNSPYYSDVKAFNKSKQNGHKNRINNKHKNKHRDKDRNGHKSNSNNSKKHRDKSPKKIPKKPRPKTKSTKNAHSPSNSTSNYQEICVNVPALNKISPSSKTHNKTNSGRKLRGSPSSKRRKTSSTNNRKDRDKPDREMSIPPAITNVDAMEGQMEVAYSQQYPQVGFPYIYNNEGPKSKRFTCKFMDASSMTDGVPGFCDRQFGQKCHWMRHCLEKHVPTEMSQRYQCKYCNMKYAQNSSLKEHVAICHSNKPPSFKCPYCQGDITFTRWTSVLRHCRNQHPDQEEPKKQIRTRTKKGNNENNNTNGNINNRVKRGRKKGRKRKLMEMEQENDNTNNRDNRDNRNNSRDAMMEIEDNLPPMNIMPSVNVNISMNQMLSSSNTNIHPNYIANVAILPPDQNHMNQ